MTYTERECISAGECRPQHRSSKDTRRWCKGVDGREHCWQWVFRHELANANRRLAHGRGIVWQQQVCDGCGKQRGWSAMRPVHLFCGTPVEKTRTSERQAKVGPSVLVQWFRCPTCKCEIRRRGY